MTTLVTLRDAADAPAFTADCEAAGYQAAPIPGLAQIVRVECAFGDFTLGTHRAVRSVEDGDTVATLHATPVSGVIDNVDLTGFNWGHVRTIRRDPPWGPGVPRFPIETFYDAVRDGTGVDIYLLDTGIFLDHVEFAGGRFNILAEVVSSNGKLDDNSHGTRVASTVAGHRSGIARGATVWSTKVVDSSGSGTLTNIVTGLGIVLNHYRSRAATNRPAVVSLSLGITDSAGALFSATLALVSAGVAVFASAGNDKSLITSEPAIYSHVVAVGGIRADDAPYLRGANGTSFGTAVRILGPASDVWVASNAGPAAYTQTSGTSFSTPLVAGVVACMLQGHPRLNSRWDVDQLIERLLANATTGRLQNTWADPVLLPDLTDRIAYLDPLIATEDIRPPEAIASDQRGYVVFGPETRAVASDQRAYVIVET